MWSDNCKISINQHIPNYRLEGRSTGHCGKPASHIWTKTKEETGNSWRVRNTGLTAVGTQVPVCKRHASVLTKSRTSQDWRVWYMIWTLRQGEAVLEPKAVEPAPVPEKEEHMTQAEQEIKSLEAQLEALKSGNRYKVVVRYGDGENFVSYEENYALAIGTLTKRRDEEVGTDFYEDHMDYLQKWSADPENDGKLLLDEIRSLLVDDLMDTPMVGSVAITFIGEGDPLPAWL
jgi:hypothetical protein